MMPNSKINRIVVMGASAGGIDALGRVVNGLPADFATAVLIVQHLQSNDEPTRLPEVLGRRARLPVLLAENGMNLKPATIFVAEPGKHLRIKNNLLALDAGEPVRFVRPSVDVLFTSAAEAFGKGVIGVILTGIGSDGTQGCRQIKAHGGVTIAQDKETAAFFDMPEAAIKAGAVDFVLPLEEIAGKILGLMIVDC